MFPASSTSFSQQVDAHLAAFRSAELDPIHINIAETVAGDPRSTKVVVFIDIHVEHGVKINEVFVQRWLQRLQNGGRTQPLVEAW